MKIKVIQMNKQLMEYVGVGSFEMLCISKACCSASIRKWGWGGLYPTVGVSPFPGVEYQPLVVMKEH